MCKTACFITLENLCHFKLRNWKGSDNGKVPGDAIKLWQDYELHHFCRVVKNGWSSYGFLTSGQTQCKYADLGTDKVKTSGNYDILTGPELDGSWAIKLIRGQTADDLKKNNAIPCNLDFNNTSDCYLGVGYYKEGICKEDFGVLYTLLMKNSQDPLLSDNIGVIIPSRRRVLMPLGKSGGKLSVCRAYAVLVK